MTALSIQPTYPIFTDIDGQPLEDGYVWIGVANLAPIVNPITVYWDAALTIPAVQPIRTRGGYPINSGTPARLYVNSNYSIQVQNKNGSVVYSAPTATERYSDVVVSGVNASEVQYDPPFVGALNTGYTAQDKFAQTVSVLDFGADPTGLADSTAAIQAALDSGSNVFVPKGNYLISATLNYTTNNQVMYGEGFAAINVAIANPLTNTNMSQIFTNTALSPMLNMGDFRGTQLRNMYFNGRGTAINGITMSPTGAPSLGFNIVVQDVFINDVVNIALNTGFAVDSTLMRISVNGFNNGVVPFTDTAIRVGATNITVIGAWFHGCKRAVRAAGSVARFIGCTFTSFPYNASQEHILVEGGGTANYNFMGCYFETMKILNPNGLTIGVYTFSDCFLDTQDPNNLFDLSGSAGNCLTVAHCRVHETTLSSQITANGNDEVNCIGNGQIDITFAGSGRFSKIDGKFVYSNGGFGSNIENPTSDFQAYRGVGLVNPTMTLQKGGGATAFSNATSTQANFGSASNHPVFIVVNSYGAARFNEFKAALGITNAVPSGGSQDYGVSIGDTVRGIYYGSGVPTLSAARGSIYIRTDAVTATTRLYVNTDDATSWAYLTTSV